MGLPDFEPLDLEKLGQPLGPGYHSEVNTVRNGRIICCAGRRSNCDISADLAGRNYLDEMKGYYDGIIARMATQRFNTFAENLERFYHNTGHGAIGQTCKENDDARGGNIMGTFSSARDPIFYRWHTHIEDLFQMYNDRRGPYTKKDFQLSGGLKVMEVKTIMEKAKLETSKDVENILVTFDEDATDNGNHHQYRRVNHHQYKYQIKLLNPQEISKKVIVRIFLALGNCLKIFLIRELIR